MTALDKAAGVQVGHSRGSVMSVCVVGNTHSVDMHVHPLIHLGHRNPADTNSWRRACDKGVYIFDGFVQERMMHLRWEIPICERVTQEDADQQSWRRGKVSRSSVRLLNSL